MCIIILYISQALTKETSALPAGAPQWTLVAKYYLSFPPTPCQQHVEFGRLTVKSNSFTNLMEGSPFLWSFRFAVQCGLPTTRSWQACASRLSLSSKISKVGPKVKVDKSCAMADSLCTRRKFADTAVQCSAMRVPITTNWVTQAPVSKT